MSVDWNWGWRSHRTGWLESVKEPQSVKVSNSWAHITIGVVCVVVVLVGDGRAGSWHYRGEYIVPLISFQPNFPTFQTLLSGNSMLCCYGNSNAWHLLGRSNMDMEIVYCVSNSSVFISDHLHCSLYQNGLTSTGAISLARALHHNKSLKELKWVVNWVSYYLIH